MGIKPRHSHARIHILNPGPSSKDKTSEAVWEGKWNIPISLKKEFPSMHGEGLWVPVGLAGGFLSPSPGHGVAPRRRLRDWLSVHLRWVCPGFLWGRAGCDHPVQTRNIWLLQVSLPKGLTPLTPGAAGHSHRELCARQPKEKWAFSGSELIWPKLVRSF